MATNQEARPIYCPFCGSQKTKMIGSWALMIKCLDCKAIVYFDDSLSEDDLIRRYNQRAHGSPYKD